MAVKKEVLFSGFLTPYSVVVGHQRFRGLCSIHLQASRSSETLVCSHKTTRHINPENHDLCL